MAQYKVPQDVEADDKLLGPFTFRQFVYLLIAGGLIALAVGLFQLFPALAIIPVPFILLFAVLALPLKKDQPMETYLAAIVSYYLKPRTRRWMPGQSETTIDITAPKLVDDDAARKRNITGEEATHRLSFLADIVDTGGYAIKGAGVRKVSEDLVAEANATNDMFESNYFDNLENAIVKDENAQREKVIQKMERTIRQVEKSSPAVGSERGPDFNSKVVVKPGLESKTKKKDAPTNYKKNNVQKVAKPSIIELANNPDFSIATISKEAKRLKERDEGEVFISLH